MNFRLLFLIIQPGNQEANPHEAKPGPAYHRILQVPGSATRHLFGVLVIVFTEPVNGSVIFSIVNTDLGQR